ncbi:FCD domain-containing protein [Citricoccus sp. NPDC055426]|uniref:FadR/GntR family transcriptional regulator n=1 Tax=Citricoccus sp. NPDC055426 TaxID=3155536 RepID=UPI00341A1094
MPLDLESPSRATAVARYIEEYIEEKGLSAGDRIGTKQDLQQRSGVARATVNEAVRLLHDRGRISVRSGPQGGLFVADVDPGIQLGRFLLAVGKDAATVTDAMALRDFLETMVMREATEHRRPEDVTALRHCLDRIVGAGDDPGRLLPLVWEFHDRIATITPNVVLKSTYLGLVGFIRDQVKGLPDSQTSTPGSFAQERVAAHVALVDVIESGDLSRVDEVVERHNATP